MDDTRRSVAERTIDFLVDYRRSIAGIMLTTVHSLELVIKAPDGVFKNPGAWKKVLELGAKIKRIPEVVSTDSFLPLLAYLQRLLLNSRWTEGDLFSDPKLIPQILVLTSLSPERKSFTGRYLDDSPSRLHISVRVKNSPSAPIADTIEAVRSTAESVIEDGGRITVTGDIAVFAVQSTALVRSQMTFHLWPKLSALKRLNPLQRL